MAALILAVSVFIFVLAYRFYGDRIARLLKVDRNLPTPAHTMYDGIDYCPAKKAVLFGHHFASIAGAAPIVGPIIAASFGWFPVILWVVLGSVFIGAVHDYTVLIASARHKGRSVGEVIGVHVGALSRRIFLIFLWLTLILLISAFIILVAQAFISSPQAATSSIFFIAIAVLFGLSVYRWRAPVWLSSLIGVILLFICVVLGWYFPISLRFEVWCVLLLLYVFVASVTPVWILLQPRDYLNSFILYAVVVLSIVGMFAAHPDIKLPLFASWHMPDVGFIFPVLFVTVACGAVSGFHSVVASGTTAKQLDNEGDAKMVGYGAMLVEGLVAVLALLFAAMLTKDEYKGLSSNPIDVFANGAGFVMSKLGLNANKARSFATLSVSAFILTSVDTATRLARFAFQEFFAPKASETASILNRNRYIGTLVTVAASAALAFSNKWRVIWPLFGSANQLLAALALLAVSVWLKKTGRRGIYTLIPMVFMLAVTISSLINIITRSTRSGNVSLVVIASALLIMAFVIVFEAVSVFKNRSGASSGDLV